MTMNVRFTDLPSIVGDNNSSRCEAHIWHVITGEYPPSPGGVSDYTAQVAQGLVTAGETVHIWTSGDATTLETSCDAVAVHRMPAAFAASGLQEISHALDEFPTPRTLLIQYVPQAFGQSGMNLKFADWIARRHRMHGDRIQLMVHEAAFPWVAWPWHHNLISGANRWMLWRILSVCDRVFMSTAAWQGILMRYGRRDLQLKWLPIPTNLPASVLTHPVIDCNSSKMTPHPWTFGHFGTFGGPVREMLSAVCDELFLSQGSCKIKLLGRGALRFQSEILSRHPERAETLEAYDGLTEEELATEMECCDLAIQPYPDGITTRRTTAMGWLALGIPLLTNLGKLSESIWTELSPAALIPGPDPRKLAQEALRFQRDPAQLNGLKERSRTIYQQEFSLEKTIRSLLDDESTITLAASRQP